MFDSHEENNFNIVEKEYKNIQEAIKGLGQTSAEGNVAAQGDT